MYTVKDIHQNALIIRVTERQTFKKCRRRWQYAYRERLAPRDAKTDARTHGSTMHTALARFYNEVQKQTPQELVQAMCLADFRKIAKENGLSEELWELGESMIQGYVDKYYTRDSSKHTLFVEQTFYAPIPGTRVWLQGTPDWITEHSTRDDRVVVYDHKNYRSLLSEEQVETEDQLTLYMWLLKQNGITCYDGCYNMLRKKIPRVPEVLKSGALSKNKSIDTTKDVYLGSIIRNGLDPRDYQEFLDTFEEKDFFKRISFKRSKDQIDTAGEWLKYEARDMSYKDVAMYPSFDLTTCVMCDFATLCRVEQNKGDVEQMKKVMYQKVDEIILNRRES